MGDGRERSEQLEDRERAAVWNLWQVRGVQFPQIVRLEQRIDGCFAEVWDRDPESLERLLAESGFGEAAADQIREMARSEGSIESRYRAELDRLPEGARLVHIRDPEFPSRLFDLEEPPVFLYVYGDLAACRRDAALSVVGSRDAGVRDVRRARRMVGSLADAGLTVVSGGALGIDRAAHEGALDVGGETVVLLPAGLDHPSPSSNRDVFRRAVEDGAVLTEYPLGVDVRRYHFPRRNRLIAALGDATFVVRAAPDSGTMLTVEAARKIDRPICALAGDLDEPLAEGCLQLIVDGAQAVRHAGDILEHQFSELDTGPSEADGEPGPDPSHARSGTSRGAPEPDLSELSDDGRALAEAVREADVGPSETLHADRLRALVEWPTGRLQTALLELELHGLCEKAGGALAYRFHGIGGGA